MPAVVLLEHAFAEAERELDELVKRVVGWRDMSMLRILHDRYDNERPWMVEQLLTNGACLVRGRFRWLAAANAYAEQLAAETPSATVERFEPEL